MDVKRLSRVVGVLVIGLCVSGLHAQTDQVAHASFEARDSPRTWTDDDPATRAFLAQFAYEPAAFKVRCTSTPGLDYDALVKFDSPKPSGQKWVDEVVMLWYAARDENQQPIEAPAVLMVHSLHPQMIVAKQIARTFAKRGIHAFVIELPGYGLRWDGRQVHPGVTALEHGRQAVADCLRAHDAVKALPNIKPGPIALQGTSLGGYVAAAVGGIDTSFEPVLLLISGADGYGTLMNGQHDARYLKEALAREGYQGDALRKLLDQVEPLHVASRLDPENTYLISANDDVTIPKANSDALADAVGLDASHHVHLQATHYTTMVLIPAASEYMANIILGQVDDAGTGDGRAPVAATVPNTKPQRSQPTEP